MFRNEIDTTKHKCEKEMQTHKFKEIVDKNATRVNMKHRHTN
jgi:hypothetical protein